MLNLTVILSIAVLVAQIQRERKKMQRKRMNSQKIIQYQTLALILTLSELLLVSKQLKINMVTHGLSREIRMEDTLQHLY